MPRWGTARPAATATLKGELRVWTSGSPEVEVAFDKLMGDYMKARPNVKIIHESAPYEQYFQKITTAVAGGGGPDVFWIDINTAGFAKRGILLRLDKFVSKAYVEDAFPIALQRVSGTVCDGPCQCTRSRAGSTWTRSSCREEDLGPPRHR